MGANAQTSVPTFTAGDVLTAANMNISARTGVPVFASTVTRDAAFGGTGEKTLAEGQMCYVEGTGFQTYNGTSWVTWGTAPSTGGLVYLTGATFTSATSFSLPNSTFTSTYRNYRMLISLSACTSDADFTVRMRASGTDNTSAVYDYALVGLGTVGASNSQGGGQTSWVFGETDSANVRNAYAFDILNPQIAQTTTLFGIYSFVPKSPTDVIGRNGYWQHNSTTQFDSLSFISSVASSITGVYRVYGYADS